MTRRYERIGRRTLICMAFALAFTVGALTCRCAAPAKDPQCEWCMAAQLHKEGKDNGRTGISQ